MTTTDMGTGATREEMIENGVIARPKQPSIADRRKIRDELEALYDIKNGRYHGAHTDTALAEKLDVPRSWVSDIRAQFFGDLGMSEADAGLVAEIQAAMAEFKSLKGRVGQQEGKIEQLLMRAEKCWPGAVRR